MKPFIEKEIRLTGPLTLKLVTKHLNKYTCLHKKRSIISTYFDTKTHDLLKNSIALRVRTDNNRNFFQLKIEKRQGLALEWQVKSKKTDKRLNNPNSWGLPTEKYLKSINAIPKSLNFKEKIDVAHQIFFTQVERTSWMAKFRKATFIVSLDKGIVTDNKVTNSIFEIEIEVENDPNNYFLDFCLALKTKFPLTSIEGRTKAYRGVELIYNKNSLMFYSRKKLIKAKKNLSTAKKLYILASKIIVQDSSSFIEKKSQNHGLSLLTSVHQTKEILVILGHSHVFFNTNEHKNLFREIYTFDKLLRFLLKKQIDSKNDMKASVKWTNFLNSQSRLLINIQNFEVFILKYSNF